jgi:uncharacterized protein YndB with AHSA1/START domain
VTQPATIEVDQFIAAPPAKVWRALTDPRQHAKWWAPGDIAAVVGHRFHLRMPGYGDVPCEVLEVEPESRFVYTFHGKWTIAWRLVAEGAGTRLFLEQSGLDLDDPEGRKAFDRMGSGWRTHVLPRLERLVTTGG